jgi:hypothetical protein
VTEKGLDTKSLIHGLVKSLKIGDD